MKLYYETLERLLEQSKKLRKNYEKALEESKDNEKIHSQLIEIFEPIKEIELTIIDAMNKLHLNSLQFLKETIEWNDKTGRSNDYLVKELGQKVIDEALSLKD